MIVTEDKAVIFPDKEDIGDNVDFLKYSLMIALISFLCVIALPDIDELCTLMFGTPDNLWMMEHNPIGSYMWKLNKKGLSIPLFISISLIAMPITWVLQRRRPKSKALRFIRISFFLQMIAISGVFCFHISAFMIKPIKGLSSYY